MQRPWLVQTAYNQGQPITTAGTDRTRRPTTTTSYCQPFSNVNPLQINPLAMIKLSLIPVLALISIFSQANTYNIKDFGAKGDGKTIDSPAINRAIEAAAQAGR